MVFGDNIAANSNVAIRFNFFMGSAIREVSFG